MHEKLAGLTVERSTRCIKKRKKEKKRASLFTG